MSITKVVEFRNPISSADIMLSENLSFTGLSKGQKLCREKEEGNREYKFKLTGLTDEQRTHRITQAS